MKKLLSFTITALLIALVATSAHANNLRVTNVSLYRSPGQPTGTIDIKFDVAWDNSYSGTDSNNQPYFDRAWVFVKYFKTGWDQATQPWVHATLTTGGTLSTYSTATNTGISPLGEGAFCQIGTNQTVRWNYSDGAVSPAIASTDTIQVKVFGIEMVYIPQGPFDLGDGNGTTESTYAFHVIDNTGIGLISSTPRIGTTLVSNIKVDANAYDDDQLERIGIGIKGDGGLDTNNDSTIENADYPTGYKAFYIMKYELSQGAYRDFLNTLTSAQQAARCFATTVGNFMGDVNTYTTPQARNGIQKQATGFVCNLNNNGVYNEADDGEWIACNYLSWADLSAYADWAGLRPMTELEFEKAARGPTKALSLEYAWGNTTIDYFSDLSGSGTTAEAKGATRTAANCNYSNATPDGPVRCGIFATSSSTRTQAGGSYYGVMELSGNLWERPVTVGNSAGRAFAGSHGDGNLSTVNTDWPLVSSAVGSGYRGGAWDNVTTYARVSDRSVAAYTSPYRYYNLGARVTRTSP